MTTPFKRRVVGLLAPVFVAGTLLSSLPQTASASAVARDKAYEQSEAMRDAIIDNDAFGTPVIPLPVFGDQHSVWRTADLNRVPPTTCLGTHLDHTSGVC